MYEIRPVTRYVLVHKGQTNDGVISFTESAEFRKLSEAENAMNALNKPGKPFGFTEWSR
jgi:hypothetical protein